MAQCGMSTLRLADHQAEMVRQQAVRERRHRQTERSCAEDLKEVSEIGWLVKDFRAGIASVEDVIDKPRLAGPGCARHRRSTTLIGSIVRDQRARHPDCAGRVKE